MTLYKAPTDIILTTILFIFVYFVSFFFPILEPGNESKRSATLTLLRRATLRKITRTSTVKDK